MKTCKKCKHKVQRSGDLYCSRHAKQLLQRLEREGYFEPLTYKTSDGLQILSKQRFLTLSE